MDALDFKEQIKKLPAKPGIYLFKNFKNKPLYIGKALNLKNRVSHYLKSEDPRLKRMLTEAVKIDFILADSDIEALILESQYIKKYHPDFNIMLRDDKQYFYVSLSHDDFPQLFLTHQPSSRDSEYIGPFTDGNALKTTLRLLRKVFPYCTCKQKHNNYCLNYHIGKCPGFCCLKKGDLRFKIYDLRDYKKNINSIKNILSGGKESVLKNLEKEMKALSAKEDYEKAIELRSRIEKLKRVFENAKLINTKYSGSHGLEQLAEELDLTGLPARIEAYDIANIQGKYAAGAMIVFTDGKADKNEYRKFKIYTKDTPDDTAMLKEVLTRRFNHPEWPLPQLILIDGGRGQLNAALGIISGYKLPIKVIALTKNEKHFGHKIITEGKKEISLSKLPFQVKNLLLQIDGEAHRFAITYYRKLHGQSLK